MILSPEEYSAASTYDLVREAARGYVPLDRRFLRVVLEREAAVVPDFLRFLGEPREQEDRVDIDAVLLDIVRQLRSPEMLPVLAEMAKVDEFSLSDELTEAFVELGPASVDTLLSLYEESKGADDVAFTLAGLGVHDPRILEVLTARMAADPADGALALGLYGDPAAKPVLEEALEAAGDNERLRQELQSAISDLERPDQTQPEPFDVFPNYLEEDLPSFAAMEDPELLEFLKSPVAEYRARAIRMLAFEEPSPEIVKVIFEKAQSDPDPHVRGFAWEGLEGVHEPAEIDQAVRAKVLDEAAPPEERAGALIALAHESREDEEIRRLILDFYEHEETRAAAVKAMWHSGDRRFESAIPGALDAADLDVRRQAITAAGIFGMVSVLGRIEKLFENEDLRQAALYAYALAAPSPVTPARMKSLFRKIEDLAGGLDDEESMIVGKALDDRLEAHEYDPVFLAEDAWEDEEDDEEEAPAPPPAPAKVGRNDPCPCGSGKKYKKCCGQ